MEIHGDNGLRDEAVQILELLDDEGGLRIEEIADREDMDYAEAQTLVHHLWDRSLVVSGPEFEFESDPEEPQTI